MRSPRPLGRSIAADPAVSVNMIIKGPPCGAPAFYCWAAFDLLPTRGHPTMCSAVSRKPSPLDWCSALVLVGTVVVTCALYERLPDPMPSHFGVSGSADGWMPRPIAAWLLPVATMGLGALLRLGQWIMPRQWRPAFRSSPTDAIVLVFVTMLCGMHLLILHASLDSRPRLGGAIWVLAGAALIATGQLMPRTSRNWLFGFRTKWSMASDENWVRAQRVGGHACTIGGAAIAILGGLGFPGLAFAALLLMGAGPLVWSWTVARRDT